MRACVYTCMCMCVCVYEFRMHTCGCACVCACAHVCMYVREDGLVGVAKWINIVRGSTV